MSPLILSAILLAAILHATWNALIKISGDRLVIMAATTAITSILTLPLLVYLPLPSPSSWVYLALSAAIHTFYMLVLVRAYGKGDFAQIYPLTRGSAPLLTAVLGLAFLRETMSATESLGMALIVAGIFALALETNKGKLQLTRSALFYSLLTSFCIACYSMIDGIGVRVSENSLSFIVWMFFLNGFGVPFAAFLRRPRNELMYTLKSTWKSAFAVAILSTTGYALVVWGFSQERIAPIAVLRETSVLFALLISYFLIKETFSLARVLIVTLILTGIVLLAL
ncbi:MAG: EamA family transporter [Pseudohongiellaceae bacterium]